MTFDDFWKTVIERQPQLRGVSDKGIVRDLSVSDLKAMCRVCYTGALASVVNEVSDQVIVETAALNAWRAGDEAKEKGGVN